ncbi:MAG: LPS assembly lipoprotein LptE [Bacteroidota bacterium]
MSNKNLQLLILRNAVLISILITLISCSYSFTGASVPPHINSVAIPLFIDRSGTGELDVSEKITNSLIQKFNDDNTLLVTDRLKANSIVEGTIIAIKDDAAVVSGNETITRRRITINIKVIYKDLVKKQTIFERNFSNYEDYSVEGDLFTSRQKAIDSAIENITEDILLGVVSNW